MYKLSEKQINELLKINSNIKYILNDTNNKNVYTFYYLKREFIINIFNNVGHTTIISYYYKNNNEIKISGKNFNFLSEIKQAILEIINDFNIWYNLVNENYKYKNINDFSFLEIFKNIKNQITNKSTYSKDKSNQHGEVFTPTTLIKEMLGSLDEDSFTDPTKTFLDPCAGKGNFPVFIIQGLMKGLEPFYPKTKDRYKHIIENMLYMCEFQRESAEFINDLFSLEDQFKVNLYVGDTLTMPDDFFDLSYEERKIKYPDNCI